VYVLEANPRASRTVPLVSKVCRIEMARIATQLMLGAKLAQLQPKRGVFAHYGVKEAVFPFNMMPEVDPVLGPEMRSTGEVLGLASTFGEAFFKAQEAAGQLLPLNGTVLITVAEEDRPAVVRVARQFAELGFRILATSGTAAHLAEHGIAAQVVNKMHEGRPHIVDCIKNCEIDLIVNTPAGKQSQHDDSYIRKNAIKYKVSYITTLAGAAAAAKGIAARRRAGSGELKALQQYHSQIAQDDGAAAPEHVRQTATSSD
jgi:carbamoyl-phosphate synthase large subunit